MSWLDKGLLLLLVILLPLGLIVSRTLFEPENIDESDSKQEQLLKIEKLLDKLAEQKVEPNDEAPPPDEQIIVEEIKYASESGLIVISGKAPDVNLGVYISTTVFGSDADSSVNVAVKDANALGKEVEIAAVRTVSGGSFAYDYFPEKTSGILEIRVVQGEVVSTVQYDLGLRKRLN